VRAAEAVLRQVRFGRDGSELTTRAYAGGIALYLRWCVRSGRDWRSGATDFGMFILWLRHAGPPVSGVEAAAAAQVLPGPGMRPVRNARRINAVLSAVRGAVPFDFLVVHAVDAYVHDGEAITETRYSDFLSSTCSGHRSVRRCVRMRSMS